MSFPIYPTADINQLQKPETIRPVNVVNSFEYSSAKVIRRITLTVITNSKSANIRITPENNSPEPENDIIINFEKEALNSCEFKALLNRNNKILNEEAWEQSCFTIDSPNPPKV